MIPEHLKPYLSSTEPLELADARLPGELSKAIAMREAGVEGDWDQAEALIREAMRWVSGQLRDRVTIRKSQAESTLKRSDWVVTRALEASVMGEAWCAWRDTVRRIAETGEGEIPPEPPRLRAQFDPHAEPAKIEMPEFLKGDEPIPAELADLFDPADTAPESNEKLLVRLREVLGLIGLAEDNGGRAAPELYRRKDRLESGIRWNRGRLAEVI
jgi:hypothetical protein